MLPTLQLFTSRQATTVDLSALPVERICKMGEIKRRKVARDAPKKKRVAEQSPPAASPESTEESATLDGAPVEQEGAEPAEDESEAPKTFKELVCAASVCAGSRLC